jgi:PAS domain S-box-containing protein
MEQLINNYKSMDAADKIYRDFFEYGKVPMFLVEEDTIISLCNRAFETLSGYSRDEVQGKMSWIGLISDTDSLEKMKGYHRKRRINPASVPEEYEFVMVTDTGEKKDIALNITMLPGTKKSIAFLLDITERKICDPAAQYTHLSE